MQTHALLSTFVAGGLILSTCQLAPAQQRRSSGYQLQRFSHLAQGQTTRNESPTHGNSQNDRRWNARVCGYGDNPLLNRSGAVCLGTDGVSANVGRGPVSVNNDGAVCVGARLPIFPPNLGLSLESCLAPNGAVTTTAGLAAGPGAGQRLVPSLAAALEFSYRSDPRTGGEDSQPQPAYRPNPDRSPSYSELDEAERELGRIGRELALERMRIDAERGAETRTNEGNAQPVQQYERTDSGMTQEQFRANVAEQMEQFRQADEYNRQNPLQINVPASQPEGSVTVNQNVPEGQLTFNNAAPEGYNAGASTEYAPRENRVYRADGTSEPIGQGDQVGYSYRRDGAARRENTNSESSDPIGNDSGSSYRQDTGEPAVRENRSYSTDGSSRPIGSGRATTPAVGTRERGTASDTAAVRLPF